MASVTKCSPALPELGSERKAFLKVKWLAKVGVIVMSRPGESGESGCTGYQTVKSYASAGSRSEVRAVPSVGELLVTSPRQHVMYSLSDGSAASFECPWWPSRRA